MQKFAGYIGDLTGHEPQTCPWRSFYDPLVRAVIALRQLSEDKLIDSALGPDPPAIIHDAYALYLRAYNAAHIEELEFEREQREAKRRAEAAARKGGRHHG